MRVRGGLLVTRALLAGLALLVAVLSGCAGSGGGTDVHGSVYMGVGYYDPWYWGPPPPAYYPPPVVGPPPPGGRPPPSDIGGARPTPPIANAPPPRPVAAPRGGGGRGRR